jgi:nicotinamide-nucleotide amidase
MEAEIIAVGSELLTPARVDTNSLFLTDRLNRRGIDVVAKCVIGDHLERLTAAIRRARGSSEIVIVTGGLGPTLDDLTRDAAAAALGRDMRVDERIVEWIRERFARFGRPMTENNLRQALVIDGAEVLPNPNGTAPGLFYQDEAGVLFLLPGPPRELQPLFLAECEPRLDRLATAHQYWTSSLRMTGLGESEVDHRVGPIYSSEMRVATTILASPGDVQLHLRAQAPTVDEAREIAEALAERIVAEIGDPVFSRDGRSLEEIVGELLRKRRLRLGLAESCTGGLIAARLTDLAGASDYLYGGVVSYSEEAKTAWLGVAPETIARHGAVSAETAREMAERARDQAGGAGRAVGLSVTGVAGPGGGTDEKPVGTVYIGVAVRACRAHRCSRRGTAWHSPGPGRCARRRTSTMRRSSGPASAPRPGPAGRLRDRDSLSVHDVELGLLERRRHLVLHHLDLGAVADDVVAVLERGDASDVDAHGRVELQRAPPVVVSGLPNMTPIFSRIWLMKIMQQLDL